VVQILNVVKSIDKLFVLVYQDTLEALQVVGLSVSQAMNVLRMKHVVIKNVEILVLEHVASMRDVKL
jgi:hypothetical protein